MIFVFSLVSLPIQINGDLFKLCSSYGYNPVGKFSVMNLNYQFGRLRLLEAESSGPIPKTSIVLSDSFSWADELDLKVNGNPSNKKLIYSCPGHAMANYWNRPYVIYDVTFNTDNYELDFKLRQFRILSVAEAFARSLTTSRLVYNGKNTTFIYAEVGSPSANVHTSVLDMVYHFELGPG